MAKAPESSKAKSTKTFSSAERQAMKDRAQELKNKAKGLKAKQSLWKK